MFKFFERDIRNIKTEGIKTIQILSGIKNNVMLTIKYDKCGYPTFFKYTGLYGPKDNYELCMCRNYYKNGKIIGRIVSRSCEEVFSQYRYVYDNDLLIRTYEYEVDRNINLSSTTDYKYSEGKLTSIDTASNYFIKPEHISIEYKDNQTILMYEYGIETIRKKDDGKIAHYKSEEGTYDFIYEDNNCIGLMSDGDYFMEIIIDR